VGLYELGIGFAKYRSKTKVSMQQVRFSRRSGMKRLLALILVWTLLVITGTLVSADGKTRDVKDVNYHQCSIKKLDKLFRTTEAK
jgi:hypothetical protein